MRLDGAGVAKLSTLEDAQNQLHRVHAIVERIASAMRSEQTTAPMKQQLTRAATPLVGLLKPQFGLISQQVTDMILVASRGGGDQMKLRAMREAVAQIRTQLDLAVAKVKEQHDTEKPGPRDKPDASS